MRIPKKLILVALFLAAFSLSAFSLVRSAQAAPGDLISGQTGMNEIGTVYGGSNPTDIRVTIAQIINMALGFIGAIFLGLTIFAGFKYMTAGGNEEKTTEALALLRNAVIGLIIVLMAWGITRYSIIILSKTVNNTSSSSWYPQ